MISTNVRSAEVHNSVLVLSMWDMVRLSRPLLLWPQQSDRGCMPKRLFLRLVDMGLAVPACESYCVFTARLQHYSTVNEFHGFDLCKKKKRERQLQREREYHLQVHERKRSLGDLEWWIIRYLFAILYQLE